MRILVTGTSGHIGGAVVNLLCQEGMRSLASAARKPGSSGSGAAVLLDITNPAFVEKTQDGGRAKPLACRSQHKRRFAQ